MNLTALLRWTSEVLQLRSSPADLPYSPALMLQFVLIDLISSAMYLEITDIEYSAPNLLARTLLRLATFAALLYGFGRRDRVIQTLATLSAASALLTFIMLPIASALVRTPSDNVDLDVQFLQLGWLALILWSIVVDGHILRHALAINFWYALPLAMGLFMLTNELANQFFPLA